MLTWQISAGELGTTVEKLEAQLPLIFQRADKWNAVLLLDEADVFLEQCSTYDVYRNAMVSIFLRELECYQGIMFLTTNRVKEIDDAIASRIHLPLKYKSLGLDARRGIWESFLKKAVTHRGPLYYSRKDLEVLAGKDLNGRQVGISTGCLEGSAADQSSTRPKTLYPRPMLWQLGREIGSPLLISKSLLTRARISIVTSEGRAKLVMSTLICSSMLSLAKLCLS